MEIYQSVSLTRNEHDEIGEISVAEVIKQNKKFLTANAQSNPDHNSNDRFIQPILHINVSRGGFFSVFDRVHYIDQRTMKPVVISKDATTSLAKNSKLRIARPI